MDGQRVQGQIRRVEKREILAKREQFAFTDRQHHREDRDPQGFVALKGDGHDPITSLGDDPELIERA